MSGHITSTRYLVLQSSIIASGDVATGGVDDVGFGYVAPDELVLASVGEVDALRARVAQLEAALASPGCGEACPVAAKLREEVERLRVSRDGLSAEVEANRVNLTWYEAEVERLRDELDRMRPHAEGCNWLRRGDAYPCSCMTEVDRLREALRDVLADPSMLSLQHKTGKAVLAALAGAPSETRLPVDDEAEARFEKLLAEKRKPNAALMAAFDKVEREQQDERREQNRALAGRVREACITALAESDGDPRSLCDLDLDALLGER